MRVDLLTFGPHANTCAPWISVKRKHRLNKSWSIEGPTESCNDQTAKECIDFESFPRIVTGTIETI